VFIKPHANTEAVQTLVREVLTNRGIDITREGELTAKQIDEGKLIDQHYYAIASKATILKPDQLNVPEEKFEKKFGLPWKKALAEGKVFNASDACKELNIDSAELDRLWAEAKANGHLIKFGGGFYCGKLYKPDGTMIYVFNGFFMAMRQKFVAEGTSIYYYLVEWDPKKLSWAEFRGAVLGPTDPATAPADSLRRVIYDKWEFLGLQAQPNVGDNGVHASASPFEALAEKTNWLGVAVADDAFGAALLDAGVSAKTIESWSVDPQVEYGPTAIKTSFFDALEDTDVDECLARCSLINLGPRYKKSVLPIVGAFVVGTALGALLGAKLLKD